MRGLTVVFSVGALTLAAVGCQTITEELPTQPAPVLAGGQSPIVVVPVVLPSPVAPAPASTPRPIPTAEPGGIPEGGGGGGGGGNGGSGGGGGGGGGGANGGQAVRLGAKVFFVECNGRELPGSEHASEAPVGCRIHLDVTPKDASNKPTSLRQTPSWTFDNEGIIKVSNRNDYTPTYLATGAGTVSCYAEADGLRSNTVTVRLQ